MKKIFILCVFLVLLLIISCVLISFRNSKVLLNRGESICQGLNLPECEAYFKCRPIYSYKHADKCPEGVPCATNYKLSDREYSYCEEISIEEVKKAEVNRRYCVGNYAHWSEEIKPGFCRCYYPEYNEHVRETNGSIDFVENYGCITAKELCEKLGGTFEPDKNNAYEWCVYKSGKKEHVYIPETAKKLHIENE